MGFYTVDPGEEGEVKVYLLIAGGVDVIKRRS